MHVLVTITTLIIPFIFVIVIVWLNNDEKRKRQQLLADLYVKSIELGQPVPDNLFVEPKKAKQFKPLNTGILCIALGIGISLFSLLVVIFLSDSEVDESAKVFFSLVGSIGIIPFFIGIAFVIIHFLGKKKDTGEDAK